MIHMFIGIRSRRSQRKLSGFTLLELTVATAVFLIVGGAAFMLFHRHARLFGDQQSQIALNVSMRNALALMRNLGIPV